MFRIPRVKGNISILVLFVLIASSLMGVLTLHFTQELMKYQADVQSYYTSYYIAKAGLELGLTQAAERGVGFDYAIGTGNDLLESLACYGQCDLSVDVVGKSNLLGEYFWKGTECTEDVAFTLIPGGSLLLPLFSEDMSFSSVYDTLTAEGKVESLATYKDGLEIVYPEGSNLSSFTFGLLILEGDELYENGTFFRVATSLDDFFKQFETYIQTLAGDPLYMELANIFTNDKYTFYLLISNTENKENVSLCIAHPGDQAGKVIAFPTQKFYIKSNGIYRDKQVGIQALYKQALPDFLVNTYSPK